MSLRPSELRRNTPMLRATAPLRRTALNSSRTCLLSRSVPLRPMSEKRSKVMPQRRRVVSAMREATDGRCARCHRTELPVHGHERLGRAQGGDILTPDCLLCNECNGWCEHNPTIAAWTGWKISNKHPHDPALTSSQGVSLDGSIVEFTVPDDGLSERRIGRPS